MDPLAVTLAAVAVTAALFNWWSRVTDAARLELITKPLVTVAIGALALTVADDVPTTALVAAAAGFVLCLIGDIALLPAVDRFIVGLGSFALGHIAFVVMFVALGLDEPWLGTVALALTGLLVATVGRRIVSGARTDQPRLAVPVGIYLAVIAAMAVAGWSTGRLAAILGSTAFVVSDSVLGWRMFVRERRWMAPSVMVTYHAALVGLALSLVGPAATLTSSAPESPANGTNGTLTATSTTATPATTAAPTTSTTSTSTTTSTTSTSTTSTTSTSTTAAPTVPVAFPMLDAAVDRLVGRTTAVSVSVWRDGRIVHRRAGGTAIDGTPVDGDTPFVLASVSKLLTSLTVSKLAMNGDVVLTDPVPWDAMGIPHHPGWDDVTVRELLDHFSGMPVDRGQWFVGSGTCRDQLAVSMSGPPTSTRGSWRYSNGNYCALGILVEHVTGTPLAEATQTMVFDPLGIDGPSTVDRGPLPDMAPFPDGVGRLVRLGGAGSWMGSSDDLATVLASVRPTDQVTMFYPSVLIDQYGWGHTGTVRDAATCVWVLNDGTVVAALDAGRSPGSGGGVCDIVLPALGADLGLGLGTPLRHPR